MSVITTDPCYWFVIRRSPLSPVALSSSTRNVWTMNHSSNERSLTCPED
jgi:hypothetical protein